MGDRFERRRASLGERLMTRRGKPPPTLLAWGLEPSPAMGHNNGPPLEEEPGYVWRRYRWKKVHAAAWKTPSMGVLKFRVARAEAAGLDYRSYMLTLLDTGRFAQAKDQNSARAAALTLVRRTWHDVVARVAATASRVDRGIWFDGLAAAYDEPHRAYHELRHIAAMLRGLSAQAGQGSDALVLAILFHDVIYDPTRNDNEAESALRAQRVLTALGVSPALTKRVSELVLATAHFATASRETDPETALLLDLDLAILAATPADYDAYCKAIRHEYKHVPDDAFAAGRKRVLAHFIALRPLFLTPALADRWDAAARENLAGELARLGGA
jgi:predicted metal-dependent HD superfamily phosphohydrolase